MSGVLQLLAAQGAVATWTPASLPSLLGWYSADYQIYSDLGTTPVTDGGTVEQWNDKSGNGYNAIQLTGPARPIYRSAGFNTSYPTLDFAPVSGGNLSVAMTTSGNNFSMFAVIQYGTDGGYDEINIYKGLTNYIEITSPPGNIPFTYDGSTQAFATGALTAASNYRVGFTAGAATTFYTNNIAGTPAGALATIGSPGTLSVGSNPTNHACQCRISEVVFTNAIISSGDLTSLDDYFKTKWGL